MIEKNLKYRILEIIPGGAVIFIFLFLFIFTFVSPIFVIYFIIVYDILWLFKVIYMEINLIAAWNKLKKTISINWFEKLKAEKSDKWEDIYHLVLLPVYKEPNEIIEASFEKLSKTSYDLSKMIVVLAGEGVDDKAFLEKVKIIEEKFGNTFLKFIHTVHYLQEGEVQGKGSNCCSAGKIIKDIIDSEFSNIPYENIIVSNFDIDTIVHEQYFAHLSYLHLTIDNPTRTSYQPIAVFNNNFWEATSSNRIVARGTTFWLLSDFMKNDRLLTFSSHSMNFKALVDVGFWHNDVVSEDSRIGLQCINYYNGDYKVLPVYLPVSLDVVDDNNIVKSIINQYKQQRRWAYGMENFPYLMTSWIANKKMPFFTKFSYIYNQLEGGITWATAPIIMFLFGFFPLLIVNITDLSQSIIVRNAPFILQTVMRIGMFGMIINAFISFLLLPKTKGKVKFYEYIILFGEWMLLPFTTIILGSLPAIDAYMRLMLGKYMGFWVTPKSRK